MSDELIRNYGRQAMKFGASKDVDPENETAYKAMMDEAREKLESSIRETQEGFAIRGRQLASYAMAEKSALRERDEARESHDQLATVYDKLHADYERLSDLHDKSLASLLADVEAMLAKTEGLRAEYPEAYYAVHEVLTALAARIRQVKENDE